MGGVWRSFSLFAEVRRLDSELEALRGENWEEENPTKAGIGQVSTPGMVWRRGPLEKWA